MTAHPHVIECAMTFCEAYIKQSPTYRHSSVTNHVINSTLNKGMFCSASPLLRVFGEKDIRGAERTRNRHPALPDLFH